jgi:hypothetical protein
MTTPKPEREHYLRNFADIKSDIPVFEETLSIEQLSTQLAKFIQLTGGLGDFPDAGNVFLVARNLLPNHQYDTEFENLILDRMFENDKLDFDLLVFLSHQFFQFQCARLFIAENVFPHRFTPEQRTAIHLFKYAHGQQDPNVPLYPMPFGMLWGVRFIEQTIGTLISSDHPESKSK